MENTEMNSSNAERSARLVALTSKDGTRSKAALLREVFGEVEAAIRAGVPQIAIIEELAATGLVFTPQTFALTLGRIRKQLSRQRTNHQYGRTGHCVPLVVNAVAPLEELDDATPSPGSVTTGHSGHERIS